MEPAHCRRWKFCEAKLAKQSLRTAAAFANHRIAFVNSPHEAYEPWLEFANPTRLAEPVTNPRQAAQTSANGFIPSSQQYRLLPFGPEVYPPDFSTFFKTFLVLRSSQLSFTVKTIGSCCRASASTVRNSSRCEFEWFDVWKANLQQFFFNGIFGQCGNLESSRNRWNSQNVRHCPSVLKCRYWNDCGSSINYLGQPRKRKP